MEKLKQNIYLSTLFTSQFVYKYNSNMRA